MGGEAAKTPIPAHTTAKKQPPLICSNKCFLSPPWTSFLKCEIWERFSGGQRMSPAKEKIASHSFPKDFSRTVGKGTERICELTKDIFECLQTSKDQTKVLFSGFFITKQVYQVQKWKLVLFCIYALLQKVNKHRKLRIFCVNWPPIMWQHKFFEKFHVRSGGDWADCRWQY